MPKVNNELAAETAKVLLEGIKSSAETYSDPSKLLELAQAFAVVTSGDPAQPPPTPRIGNLR